MLKWLKHEADNSLPWAIRALVSVYLLFTRVTSSLLPANADVKNVWNVISTHTYIHNVSVQS